MLGKYDALYTVMARAFGVSAFEVNRMMPHEAAAMLDIKPERDARARPSHAARVDPRAQRATPEDLERAAAFRRELIAAQQAADD